MKVIVERTNFVSPSPTQNSTVYEAENFMEVVTSNSISYNLQLYRRVDKNHFIDIRTGELREYQQRERTSDDLTLYSKSFNELKRIISANFTGSSAEGHITLTVAPVFDASLSAVQEYFRTFIKKLR